MGHPRPVGRPDGPGQRRQQFGRVPLGLRSPADPGLQAPPLQQLQGDEGEAPGLADVVDLDHVGVPEPGDGPRLDPEPGQVLRGRVAARPDHLQRDQPVQPVLAGPVDDPHPPLPQPPEDLVPLDPRALPALGLGLGLGLQARQGRRVPGRVTGGIVPGIATLLGKSIDPGAPDAQADPVAGQFLQRLLAGPTPLQVPLDLRQVAAVELLLQELDESCVAGAAGHGSSALVAGSRPGRRRGPRIGRCTIIPSEAGGSYRSQRFFGPGRDSGLPGDAHWR